VAATSVENTDMRRGEPQVYVPAAQDPSRTSFIILRAKGGGPSGAGARNPPEDCRSGPATACLRRKDNDERLDEGFAPFQIMPRCWPFRSLALLLAGIGVYAVVSFSIAQRRRELGIRAALGADRLRLTRLVLRQGVTLLAVALVPGLLAGAAAATGLRSLLLPRESSNPAFPRR